jgi:hypothetical protein
MNIMNTTRVRNCLVVAVAVLTATVVHGVAFDQAAPRAWPTNQPATTAVPEKNYTGTVVSVDPREHLLSVKKWALSMKTFNLGDNCAYGLLFTTVASNHGQANDLRPGEKVTVTYQDSHGVLIADRVDQRPVRFEGTVAAIAPDTHTLILHRQGLDKEMTIGADCIVLLRGQKPGTLADIHAGNHVTVIYETPGGTPTAREITQTSPAFTGTVTAIDLGEKTVKAKALFEAKKFNVADDCAIVINGRTDGKLSDLKPDEKLVFNYDEINGVKVVNRIGTAPAEPQPKEMKMSTSPAYPGY